MGDSLECPAAELYALGKELLGSGASLRFEVGGWSMYPFIRDGDVIEVVPVLIDEICVGDVVFFRSGDHLLAHRVVGWEMTDHGLRVRARGDMFLQEDPPIGAANLVGRVAIVYRNQRAMRLDRGICRYMGKLAGRNEIAHRCVRWLARNGRRLGALGGKTAALKGDEAETAEP